MEPLAGSLPGSHTRFAAVRARLESFEPRPGWRAWIYPDQRHGWALVHPGKLGAWYLLMYISFVLVAAVHRPRPRAETGTAFPTAA